MKKSDLIKAIMKDTGHSDYRITEVLDSAFKNIIDMVKSGEKLTIQNFGSFIVSERQAREGRNPKTGDKIQIAACRVPKFVPGKGFKDAVN